jgi:tetratricopeptide (TPR) repeat protein
MTIHYNLYRFGVDELAVGQLINGELPTDDEERWRIVDAPRYHIKKLLDEHLRAQAALCECRDSGRPFVLFLRSFSSEFKGNRIDGAIADHFILHSVRFQLWLRLQLERKQITMLKLHGGSDGFFSGVDDDLNILSTHSQNWKAVATELIQAAAAIVFLVSHMTAGVVEEFELIRKFGETQRCLVVLLNPSNTPNSASDDTIRARIADFPNVFDLHLGGDDKISFSPSSPGPILTSLLRGARTQGLLEQALRAEFTYLEPGFVTSQDFAKTERYIWRGLRLLRVIFEDTYWATLKSYGIAFDHFEFPGAWTLAHKVYGLGIATADFRAMREALSYLGLLYIFRGADFALLIPDLAAQYDELASEIFPDGEPDTEESYASGPDPLKLPSKIGVAIRLFELAETAARDKNSETAIYLYQAAIICALRAKDGDDRERRWIVANMCQDWAKFQSESTQPVWAVTNCMFAVALLRDLATADPSRYGPDLALCLNTLGSLHFQQQVFSASKSAFVEALEIRRALPTGSQNYLLNLYTSLSNLGLLQVEIGDLDAARALYDEALAACENRLSSEPAAIVDLTRLQGWMGLCLARVSDARSEGLAYAQLAAGNLATVSQISPESAAALCELVNEALRATGGIS